MRLCYFLIWKETITSASNHLTPCCGQNTLGEVYKTKVYKLGDAYKCTVRNLFKIFWMERFSPHLEALGVLARPSVQVSAQPSVQLPVASIPVTSIPWRPSPCRPSRPSPCCPPRGVYVCRLLRFLNPMFSIFDP